MGDGFLATFDGPALRNARSGHRRDGSRYWRAHRGARGPKRGVCRKHGQGPRRRLGISFTDRGVHELKGVPGDWRLFAVESVETLASSRLVHETRARLDRSPPRESAPGSRSITTKLQRARAVGYSSGEASAERQMGAKARWPHTRQPQRATWHSSGAAPGYRRGSIDRLSLAFIPVNDQKDRPEPAAGEPPLAPAQVRRRRGLQTGRCAGVDALGHRLARRYCRASRAGPAKARDQAHDR